MGFVDHFDGPAIDADAWEVLTVLSLSSVVSIAHSGISGQHFTQNQAPDEQAQKEKLPAGEDIPEA